MPVRCEVVGALETNCYIVWQEEAPETLVVDPAGEPERIIGALAELDRTPTVIFATHGHVDHVLALAAVSARFEGAKVACMAAEREVLERPSLNLSLFLGVSLEPRAPDVLLEPGEELAVGPMRFTAIHLPGHTAGGGALYGLVDGRHTLLCGDALFAGGVGRTDFPGGDTRTLLDAIRTRLLVLPDDTAAYPGHGPQTTIGREKRENPFLQ
jgi:glyoxylase-like metal-dependent hydrolase (beta-lactamase superfamily II)